MWYSCPKTTRAGSVIEQVTCAACAHTNFDHGTHVTGEADANCPPLIDLSASCPPACRVLGSTCATAAIIETNASPRRSDVYGA